MVDFTELASTSIAAAGYDTAARELHVRFRNGRHAAYEGVPEETFKLLLAHRSPGRFFHEWIKARGHRFHYVGDAAPESAGDRRGPAPGATILRAVER